MFDVELYNFATKISTFRYSDEVLSLHNSLKSEAELNQINEDEVNCNFLFIRLTLTKILQIQIQRNLSLQVDSKYLDLAREKVLRQLESQIQSLLSGNLKKDEEWPAELIILKEKFNECFSQESDKIKQDYEEKVN